MRDHLSISDQELAIEKSERKNSKPIFDFRLRVSAGRAASEIYLSGSRKFLHIQKRRVCKNCTPFIYEIMHFLL